MAEVVAFDRIDLYDKTMHWEGRLGDPVAVSGSVKERGLDSFQFTISSTDPLLDVVLAKGSRITIRYRGKTLTSGMIRTETGTILPNGDVQFWMQGDWRVLQNTLAWVNPRNGVEPTGLVPFENLGQAWLPGGGGDAGPDGTTGGQYGYFYWPDGSASWPEDYVQYTESAIKALIQYNAVERLHRPISIAPDLNRGGDALAAGALPVIRNSTLEEPILALLDFGGLVLRVVQEAIADTADPTSYAGTIGVDVRVPVSWGAPITVGSGVIQGGTWSLGSPTATRALVGGPGEGVDRAFRTVIDAPTEAEYGDVIEVLRDATGYTLDWPTAVADALRVAKLYALRPEVSAPDIALFRAYLDSAGLRALADGAAVSGVSATLSESETFYFGGADGIQLGDTLTVQAAGESFTERITEAKFSLTKDGFDVVPVLGTKSDDPDKILAATIARLAAAQRRLTASR